LRTDTSAHHASTFKESTFFYVEFHGLDIAFDASRCAQYQEIFYHELAVHGAVYFRVNTNEVAIDFSRGADNDAARAGNVAIDLSFEKDVGIRSEIAVDFCTGYNAVNAVVGIRCLRTSENVFS
jgi:hypothetical protein